MIESQQKENRKMLYNTSLTNASTLYHRGLSRLPLAAAILGLTMLCQPALKAQTTIGYLQQGSAHPISVPPAPALQLGNCPIITFNPATSQSLCVFGPFTLPGYAGSVYVGFSGAVPAVSWTLDQAAEFQSTSNNQYNWGADTNEISLSNTSSNSVTYSINFYFKGPAPEKSDLPPDPSSLVLMVAGLASPSINGPGTTATVSAMTPLASSNGGEYTFPASAYPATTLAKWCPIFPETAACTGSAQTDFSSTACSGTDLGSTCFTFSGGATATTDSRNTGWDIYQPNSTGLTELSLNVTQAPGDGIGITLGYKVCPNLVGSFLLEGPVVEGSLFDINTKTGAATRTLLPAGLGLAFSPISPAGTLYELWSGNGSGGLITVNPINGVTTPVITSEPIGHALAADPTTGNLYFVDANANLYAITSGTGVVKFGAIGAKSSYSVHSVSAMAFDTSGNLFVVDYGNSIMLKISAPATPGPLSQASVETPTQIFPITPSLQSHVNAGLAGLAIDPWNGTVYYEDPSGLYTMNLVSNSYQTNLIGPTGGYPANVTAVNGLTFTVGACPAQ
jgi:hypothetical protein